MEQRQCSSKIRGGGNIYTDNEKEIVIGSYLGKPLYRKLIANNISFTDKKDIPISNLNIDAFVNYTGSCHLAEYTNWQFAFPFANNNTWASVQLLDNNIRIIVTNVNGNIKVKECILFIEYTKTTD